VPTPTIEAIHAATALLAHTLAAGCASCPCRAEPASGGVQSARMKVTFMITL